MGVTDRVTATVRYLRCKDQENTACIAPEATLSHSKSTATTTAVGKLAALQVTTYKATFFENIKGGMSKGGSGCRRIQVRKDEMEKVLISLKIQTL